MTRQPKRRPATQSERVGNWAVGVGLLFHLLLLAVLCMYYQELNRGLGFIEWLKAIFGKLIWQATPGFVVGALIGAFIGHIQDPGSPRSRGK